LAKGLLELPLNDPKQPALNVLQTTATFSYKGKWSILRMVRQHRASKGEYIPMFNSNAVVLKFVIPVAENTSALLFTSLSFLEPSANPDMLGKAVEFPDFPTHAPALSEEIERYRNEPVLSFGIVRASTLD
jgi:type VI secretion system protein ImpL